MAFYEGRFPEDVSAGMTTRPKVQTVKAKSNNGRRWVNRTSLYPLHEFTMNQPVLGGEEFEELRSFWWCVEGDFDGFRVKDWSDYRATLTTSSLTLVTGTTWQLNRVYTSGSGPTLRTKVRRIQKPVAGAHVYRTRSGVTTDITATDLTSLDATTGLAVIANHVNGDTYAWVGEFDVPCAFVDPAAVFRLIGGPTMLTEWTGIVLEEIRV